MLLRTIAIVSILAVAACGHFVSFKTTTKPLNPKDPGCEFDIIVTRVPRPYEEIAVIDWQGQHHPRMSVKEFRDRIADAVCGFGGDAVIAKSTGGGHYTRAIVLRWKQSSAARGPLSNRP